MQARFAFAVAFAAALPGGAGCAGTPWRYQPSAASAGVRPALTVAVLPPSDKRYPETFRSHLGGIAHLPLVPFGRSRVARPDAISDYARLLDFQANVQEALVEELRASRLFKEVRPARDQETAAVADLVLDAQLDLTDADLTRITYGLSSVGAWTLWMLGLPSGHVAERLRVVLALRPAREGAAPIWEAEVDESDSYLGGWYYNKYQPGQDFPALLKRGLAKARPSLERAVAERAWPAPQASKRAP